MIRNEELRAHAADTVSRRIHPRLLLSSVFFLFCSAPGVSQRALLPPRLHPGQRFIYRIDFSSSRNIKTESRVISPRLPPPENLTASALLQVEIVEAASGGVRLKTYYSERQLESAASKPSAAEAGNASADKIIEVTVASNGAASQIKGFDQLSPAQQFAWNAWFARFTFSLAYPKGGVHPGQKWESSERETTPSPVASLTWLKKSQYVRDERCAALAEQPKSGAIKTSRSADTCAVILVRATLKQKASPKNTTPEDYKLRNLKTRGTASGQNETILYLALSSGLLVRCTEDARQSMDVSIELPDGSNQVHYSLDAQSHSEILLLPESVQDAR